MGDVIYLGGKKIKARYAEMDKMELLEEMVRFQEERSAKGKLDLEMITKGIELFSELYHKAETPELQILTRSYVRHLQYERDNGWVPDDIA